MAWSLALLIPVFLHLLTRLSRLLTRRLLAVPGIFLGLLLLRLLLLGGLVLVGHYKSPNKRRYSAQTLEQPPCPTAVRRRDVRKDFRGTGPRLRKSRTRR